MSPFQLRLAGVAMILLLALAPALLSAFSITLLNFIGIYFVSYLVQGPLQPAGVTFNTSAEIDETAQLPVILHGTRLHAGFLVALVTALAVWLLLYRTPLGLQMRTTGLSPRATRYSDPCNAIGSDAGRDDRRHPLAFHRRIFLDLGHIL